MNFVPDALALMFHQHLPVLVVLLPAFTAMLLVLIGDSRECLVLSRRIALTSVTLGLLLALKLAFDTAGRSWSFEQQPLLLRVAARIVLPLALVVSAYIFWRGHNLPGGGFIAGLITAVALVLQFMALGQARAESALHGAAGRRFSRWIGAGLSIAGLTGVGAFAFGKPFLTSAHGHPTVAVLGELPLASAAVFDLGVYITVVGATLLMLSVLGAASKENHG